MAKKSRQNFRVQHRIEVWVSRTIAADSFEHATEIARNMGLGDYYDERDGTELIDSTKLSGLSVAEDF